MAPGAAKGTILVGYDGSAASQLALEHAAARASAQGRKLVLATVVPTSLEQVGLSQLLLPTIDLSKLTGGKTFVETARKHLEETAAALRKRGVEVIVLVRTGDAADEVIAAAREVGADEIVLGYMSYERKLPYGIGSVAEKVLRYADRSVTIVRAPGKEPR